MLKKLIWLKKNNLTSSFWLYSFSILLLLKTSCTRLRYWENWYFVAFEPSNIENKGIYWMHKENAIKDLECFFFFNILCKRQGEVFHNSCLNYVQICLHTCIYVCIGFIQIHIRVHRIHPVGSETNESLRQLDTLFLGWQNGRMA